MNNVAPAAAAQPSVLWIAVPVILMLTFPVWVSLIMGAINMVASFFGWDE